MQCTLPPPLGEDQLSAALDGEADAATLAHLAGCEACRLRLREAGRLEAALRARLPAVDAHPDAAALGDYHAGLLDQDEAQTVAGHLARCRRCSLELHDLRAFLSATPTLGGTAAPRRSPAAAATSPRGQSNVSWPQGLLLARPLATPSPGALRGGGGYTLSAEVDQLTILLEVQPSDGHATLHGQLVGDDLPRWMGALAQLRRDDELIAVAHVDEFGGFSAGPVERGLCSLFLALPDGHQIAWPDLDLGARGPTR